jgi:integrase-like protein
MSSASSSVKTNGEGRPGQRPNVDPATTLKDYTDRWLDQLAATMKPSTVALYRQRLDLHILPTLGWVPLRDLGRKQIRDLLVAKLTEVKARRPDASRGEEPALRRGVPAGSKLGTPS